MDYLKRCAHCGKRIWFWQKLEIWAVPKRIRIHSDNIHDKTGKSCAENFRESMNWPAVIVHEGGKIR